jgi:3-oxoacyl-[acyl-carrier-protein] synthase-1
MKEGSFDTELLRHHEAASPANQVARSLGLQGFRTTVCTACAAGATAIATACDLIYSGEAQIVLAGGTDSLARLTLNGFCSLLIVASDGCRPFDAERGGMSLGEGAAVLALETEESAAGRGADVLGYVLGFGNTCDAYHATAPAPDGSGIFRAMSRALDAAGISPADVDYINAHGTGTIDNDIAEGRGITRLFGEKPPPVSSTKRFFGHTLAAAGAIEAIVCILALERRCLPPNLGLRHTDPGVGFEPVREKRKADLQVAMSNSMGFGGNNCSLIVSRRENE